MYRLVLVLCLASWQSALLAANKASIPLTAATPESQGLDGARLGLAVERIAAGDYGDINALLILRHDYLVLEHYFSPLYHGKDYRYPIRSATKSFTSALVGIAREQGRMPDLQTRLLDLFPQYSNIDNLDARKRAVTLEHILSTTAGFEWNEFAPGFENDAQMLRNPDWIK